MKRLWNEIEGMVTQHYERTKGHRLFHFKMVNFRLYELYLNLKIWLMVIPQAGAVPPMASGLPEPPTAARGASPLPPLLWTARCLMLQ